MLCETFSWRQIGLGYSLIPNIEDWGYGFDTQFLLHLGNDDYDLADYCGRELQGQTMINGNYRTTGAFVHELVWFFCHL